MRERRVVKRGRRKILLSEETPGGMTKVLSEKSKLRGRTKGVR